MQVEVMAGCMQLLHQSFKLPLGSIFSHNKQLMALLLGKQFGIKAVVTVDQFCFFTKLKNRKKIAGFSVHTFL